MNPFQPDRKFLCKTSSCSQAPKQREVGKGELNRHFVAAAPHSTHSLDSKDLLGHQLPRKVQFTEEQALVFSIHPYEMAHRLFFQFNGVLSDKNVTGLLLSFSQFTHQTKHH